MKTRKRFRITGMSCAACAARIDKVLNAQPGVYEANVNYATASVQIVYDSDGCTEQALRTAVRNAGYDLITHTGKNADEEAEQAHARNYRSLKARTFGAIALAIPILIISMLFADFPFMKYILWILATVVLSVFGRSFYIHAWKQMKHGSSNMDTLVAVSTGIAYLFSTFNLLFPDVWLSRGITPHLYFEAASMIIAFILSGRLLEERAKQNTSTAIKKLMGLQPKTVTVVTDAGERTIPAEEAVAGDIIAVKPGERIAVDGTVENGESYVDESMLSGEPVPVRKEAGEKVYAGTINQKGAFRFKAEKTGSDTMLAQIIRMVQDAQGSKAPVQKLVDRIAGVFVPVIIGISILTFALWMIFAPANGFTHGLLAMVTVLIIACPCALGLATPTALIVGIGKGAEQGILIKDAASLEIARKIDAVVLDKTGTVTEGHPIVTNALWDGETEEARRILYSLERLSEHPLAEAVANELGNGETVPVAGFENIPGKGVKGTVGNETYYAGNLRLLADNQVRIGANLRQQAEKWQKESRTVIWFGNSANAIAAIAITDRIKPSSAEAVRLLREMGITVYMLTGDNEDTAQEIAKQARISHYQSGVLPQDKALFVKRLQQEGKKVGMVGDGINDSAALAQADLSIAMGKGSDIAMDTAMVTILSSDLMKISETIRLSRLTVRTIRQNLFWAFIYNLISVPVAAGILYPFNGFLLNPMIGGAAMAFSSVSVVSNSLRLKHKKIRPAEEKAETSCEIKPTDKENMKKSFKVDGMMCNHCRTHVENALNSIEGVKASVTLNPPVATVEFEGNELSLDELQQAVTQKAGDYTLHE